MLLSYNELHELILARRLRFPHGVAPGDEVALVNTGGYLMPVSYTHLDVYKRQRVEALLARGLTLDEETPSDE